MLKTLLFSLILFGTVLGKVYASDFNLSIPSHSPHLYLDCTDQHSCQEFAICIQTLEALTVPAAQWPPLKYKINADIYVCTDIQKKDLYREAILILYNKILSRIASFTKEKSDTTFQIESSELYSLKKFLHTPLELAFPVPKNPFVFLNPFHTIELQELLRLIDRLSKMKIKLPHWGFIKIKEGSLNYFKEWVIQTPYVYHRILKQIVTLNIMASLFPKELPSNQTDEEPLQFFQQAQVQTDCLWDQEFFCLSKQQLQLKIKDEIEYLKSRTEKKLPLIFKRLPLNALYFLDTLYDQEERPIYKKIIEGMISFNIQNI